MYMLGGVCTHTFVFIRDFGSCLFVFSGLCSFAFPPNALLCAHESMVCGECFVGLREHDEITIY